MNQTNRIDKTGVYPKYLVFKHPDFIPDHSHAFSVKEPRMHGSMVHEIELEQVEDFVFVLKPSTDQHARVALAAYAESVRPENPELYRDLCNILDDQ